MQTFLDMRAQAHYVTRLARNPACRLSDHAPWPMTPAAARTLQDVFATADAAGLGEARALRAERSFTRLLRCAGCGNSQPGLRLRDATPRACERCGEAMLAAAVDLEWELGRAGLPASDLRRSLQRIGLRRGDIVSVAIAFIARTAGRRRLRPAGPFFSALAAAGIPIARCAARSRAWARPSSRSRRRLSRQRCARDRPIFHVWTVLPPQRLCPFANDGQIRAEDQILCNIGSPREVRRDCIVEVPRRFGYRWDRVTETCTCASQR